MNQTFHRIVKLHIKPILGKPRNHPFKNLPDMLLHKLHLLKLLRLPLRLVSPPLRVTGMLRHLRQNRFIMLHPAAHQTPPQILLNNPMNLQIRIPPDRRRKMAVLLRRQAKMLDTIRRVLRLLHRPKRQPAQHRLLRRAL